MEFLKKNWSKLLTAIIAVSGAVLVLVPIFMASKIEFFAACQNVGIILFFVGLAAVACLKMCDKTRAYAKYTMLCASILVVAFMSIGLGGFCEDKDKAQGALGNAYAYFESIEDTIDAGKAKIAEGEAKIAGLTTLEAGFNSVVTNLGPAAATTTLAAIKADPTLAPLVTGFVTSFGGGAEAATVEASTTVAVATATVKTALSLAKAQVAEGKSQLPANIDTAKKDAEAASTAILFIYISMILALGLVPLVKSVNKSFFVKKEAK